MSLIHQKRWQARRLAWVEEQKGTRCSRCGGEFPASRLHFHHRDPSTRLFMLSQPRAQARQEAEIAKCDVVCISCHSSLRRASQWVRQKEVQMPQTLIGTGEIYDQYGITRGQVFR